MILLTVRTARAARQNGDAARIYDCFAVVAVPLAIDFQGFPVLLVECGTDALTSEPLGVIRRLFKVLFVHASIPRRPGQGVCQALQCAGSVLPCAGALIPAAGANVDAEHTQGDAPKGQH